MRTIQFKDRLIGEDQPVFVVAELSANHNQSLDIAIETIKAAKESGADAVKFQTYKPETITLDCDNDYFQVKHGTLWDGETLFSLYQKAFTPWEWHPRLIEAAEAAGLYWFSAPFDETAVDFLQKLNIPAWKVASPEITDVNLIQSMAETGKPVILSTGIAKLSDIAVALAACKDQFMLLKCVSAYPTPMEEINLRHLQLLRETFNCCVGLSDHSLGQQVPLAAVALGAVLIEKHFILDRALGGPDAAFSMEPHEFKSMVSAIRDIEKALGQDEWRLSKGSEAARFFSRSLFIAQDLKAGQVLTRENVRSVRPGQGLHPKYLHQILGKKINCDVQRGTPLRLDMVSGE